MSAAGRRATTWSLWIDDNPALAPTQLSSKARRLCRRARLDVIFIDYIGLMDSDGQAWSENDRIGRISRSPGRLAKELDVPVRLPRPASRNGRVAAGKIKLQLADRGDSGSLSRTAMSSFSCTGMIITTRRPNASGGLRPSSPNTATARPARSTCTGTPARGLPATWRFTRSIESMANGVTPGRVIPGYPGRPPSPHAPDSHE